MLNVRHCDWMIDVLLVSILVLDVHRVQAEVDLDIFLQVVRRFVSVLSFRFYFLGIRNFFNSFFYKKSTPSIDHCLCAAEGQRTRNYF